MYLMVMLQSKLKCFPVLSGVLCLLVFLLYIYDIVEHLTSHIKLFADDRLLFRTIESVAYTVDSVADTVDRVADTLALQNYFSVNCHSGPGNGK